MTLQGTITSHTERVKTAWKNAIGRGRRDSCSAQELDDVATAYGMPSLRVDGIDLFPVAAAVTHAMDRRTEWLPCFIEGKMRRFFHHAGGTPGSAYSYRTKQDEAAWLARNPVVVFPARLGKLGILDETAERALRSQPRERFKKATDTECRRAITYAETIAEVTVRQLERDLRVVVLGQQVANFGGGAATNGPRPVVEIVFSSFALVATDQLFNQAGQLGYLAHVGIVGDLFQVIPELVKRIAPPVYVEERPVYTWIIPK